MNILVNMNRHLRVTVLFSLFLVNFICFLATGNWIFIILFVFFLGLLIYTNLKHEELHLNDSSEIFKNSIAKHDVHLDDYYIGDSQLSAIGINKSENKIVVLKRKNLTDDFKPTHIPFKDIIETSLVEDGETFIKTSKSGVVGGSLIGGVLAGEVGSVVGAMTSSKTSREQARKIKLTIVVNDLNNPIHEIDFLDLPNSIDKDNYIYKDIYNNANKWYKIISVILKRNEQMNIGTI